MTVKDLMMIDTHSHILPGIDDGAGDTAEALEFIREAVSQGVTVIYATPHSYDGVYNCERDVICRVWQQLTEEVRKENLDIRIMPGSEIRLNLDLVDLLDAGHLVTLGDGGTFVLLELPPMFIAAGLIRIIYQLRERGVTPIIAHAERNPMLVKQPELALDLTAAGARLQVTAGSLTGDYGRIIFKAAKHMVETDRVFCLGSDIHPNRKYRMKAAAKTLEKWIGKKNTFKLLWENPEQIGRMSSACSCLPDQSRKTGLQNFRG
jgi:protein-tyrosine phosphatase